MCCSSFLKWMVYFIFFVTFLLAIVLLGFGASVIVNTGPLLAVVKDVENYFQILQLVNISYMLIAVCPVLLFTSILGCCGEYRESRSFVLISFFTVLIVFLVQLAGGTVLFVYQDSIGSSRGEEVFKKFHQGYGADEGLTSLWNRTMTKLNCCGFNNYKDFDGTPFYVAHGGNVYPTMCCNTKFTCSEIIARVSDFDGCFHKVLQEIESEAMLTASGAIITGAVEVVAMVVLMAFYCKGRNIFRR
ncbi:tetraspanin-1-like [Mugil cephalus]|uniref:tetraspanin-1-like n=1 Tax=Mugil cephalus TaxID=48193 RepID=UPI001FB826A9|nr:tetraspanin-1-like [Mugil cephalus]XP_047428106.1 tetraspanin-1-like [Mugil cephalus]